MNYTKQIFYMLGVEAGEEFILGERKDKYTYRINEYLLLQYKEKVENADWEGSNIHLTSILTGAYNIVKIPHPTERDREILKAGKTLGFTHAAKDEDGTIFLYAEKPGKRGHDWLASTTNSMRLFNLNPDDLAFIRWEDAEPVDLEGIK